MENNYWKIEGVNEIFRTLQDAKYHIYVGYTPQEVRKYLQYMDINHYVKGKCVSYVRITIKNDKPHYSTINKLM